MTPTPQTPAVGQPLDAESVRIGDLLRHERGLVVVRMVEPNVGLHVSYAWTDGVQLVDIFENFTFLGRPDADGWIKHEGAENPASGLWVNVRQRGYKQDDDSGWHADIQRWTHSGEAGDIIAWRPHAPSSAHPEPASQGREDLAGKLTAIRDKFLMATPDKEHTDYAVITRCILALRRPAAPAPVAGEGTPFVPGPVWVQKEAGEDGEDIWTSEVQVIGGHSVVATVHGESEAQAIQRRDAILAALTAGAEPRATEEGDPCAACGGKSFVEYEGGDGEGYPSRVETEECPKCARATDAGEALTAAIELLMGVYRAASVYEENDGNPDQEHRLEALRRAVQAVDTSAYGIANLGPWPWMFLDQALRPAAPDADKPEPRDGEAV